MLSTLTPRLSRLFFGLALLAAVSYDILFWKESVGINFLIFVKVNLLFLVIALAASKRLLNPLAFSALILSVAFAGSTASYKNEFATIIAPLLSLLLGLGFAGWVSIEANKDAPIFVHQFAFFRQFFSIFTGWKKLMATIMAGRDKIARHVLYGFLIAAPLVLIFTGLFSSADPIFADWLRRLNIFESAWRVVRIAIMTLIASGGLYILTNEKNAATPTTPKVWKMAVPTVAVVLAVLNLLFAAFVTIQIKYFFGGATYVLASGMRFADYARNGFFELARVLVLAGIIILVIHRSFAATARNWLITILQVLFISQVGVVAVSALKRMALYQDMYGFTTLRLYVAWFIYLALAVLAISGLALLVRLSFRRYAVGVIGLGLLAGAVVAYVNVDNVIATKNISRWDDEKKSLDLAYLSLMSRDAAPAFGKIVEPTNFEKLNITQKLTFFGLIDRWNSENDRSTKLGYTLSEKNSRNFLAAIPQEVKESINSAKASDRKYVAQGNEINNLAMNYAQNCIVPPLNSNTGEVKYVGGLPVNPTGAETLCLDLLKNEFAQIQAQLISSYNSQASRLEFIYAIVSYRSTDKQINILYQKKLDIMEKQQQGQSYLLLKNGSLVQSDYDNRDYYVYQFLDDGGYHLDNKKLY